MLLNRLEIKGFKSFGDKVTINFGEGVTGIVGPNGCGKSNVVDAIRWVLGEQRTKNLRSDKMENVIFNGTKNRKPAQLAEVSLTFLNNKGVLPTEYSEVTISRRYFRTGESEYLLNGVQCRLKDINNLFLDTGVGSDSYAIIELKMVDELLNDTNHSRRELFEEAAGISKFKLRKKETLKKLDDADADLARVDDLLFEIEKNLKSLERQAKQAEKYFRTKDEYRALSLVLARKIVDRQSQVLDQLRQRLDHETAERNTLADVVEQREADLEGWKETILQKEKLLASRQKALNEHEAKLRQYESDKRLKNERLRYLTDRRAALEKQLTEERQTAELIENRTRILGQEQASAVRQLAEAEQQLEKLKAAYEAQKAHLETRQQALAQQNQLIKNQRDALYQLNKSLEIKQMQHSSLRQDLERHHSDGSAHRANLAQLADELADLRDTVADHEAQVQQLQTTEANLQAQIAQTQGQADRAREELALLHRRSDALQNEFNLTKSLVDSLEGFPEAVKFLHSAPHFPKNTPLLSDLITCPDEYKIAIENYLQPYTSYYVLAQAAQALKAVDLLREAGQGKANFFINESFATAGQSLPDLTALGPGLVPALAVAEYDERYAPLLRHLLGHVVIVADGVSEWPLAQFPQLTFISQNGQLVRQRHSIAGGSVGLFEGKRLGRAKNLEKLTEQLAQLATQVTQQDELRATKLAEVQQLKAASHQPAIDRAKRDLVAAQQQFTSARVRHEQLAELIRNNALRTEDFEARLAQLQDELADAEPQNQAATQALAQAEEQLDTLSEQLLGENEELSQRSAAYNELNIKVYQLRNRVETLEREGEYKQTDLQNSRRRAEQATQELAQVQAETQQVIANMDTGDDLLATLHQERDQIEAGVREAETEFYKARGLVEETERLIRDTRRRRELADQLLGQLQNQVTEARLQITAVTERLSVEFEADLEAPQAPNPELDELPEDELRDRQRRTKESLDKIGAINPMAMEAYREIEERYLFINTQKTDLLNAKATLLQTVDEIDAVARENFLQAFGQIREHFIRVFRSLFSDEDSCDLILVEPERPLDSDIDIIAKPKGKRPLTINQLSGGEKTLTATSLLFSIYLLRPAPFCIFDEVDAPLDDANIDKFNRIIRKFADFSQFIIVTHNKRTMAATDIMYGVTMIEQGVSRVVPVDLRALAVE